MIVLSARSTSIERDRALVNNVAGRQPELVHRYLQEILLRSAGVTADPASTYDQLVASARALRDGGAVLAVQGNDRELHIGQQSDADIRAKLTEEIRLIGLLGDAGAAIEIDKPQSPQWLHDVEAAQALAHVTANVAHDAVGAMTTRTEHAVADGARQQMAIAALGILVTLIAGWSMSRHIVNRLRTFGLLAKATTAGDLTVRYDADRHDEIGVLGEAFNEMSASLSLLVGQLEADAQRDDFGRQLAEAFEMVDDEASALDIVTRAMLTAAPSAPTELLVTDANQSDLHCVAEHPTAGGPHCGVESPFGCVAVRRGAPTVFTSSEALNACPQLRARRDSRNGPRQRAAASRRTAPIDNACQCDRRSTRNRPRIQRKPGSGDYRSAHRLDEPACDRGKADAFAREPYAVRAGDGRSRPLQDGQ